MTSLKQLCKDLDQTVEEFFVTYQEILTLRHQLQIVLKDAFFLMAKARYSMGAKAVGKLQYNENDLEKAQISVQVTENKIFTVKTEENDSAMINGNPTEGLRKRDVNKQVSSEIPPGIEEVSRGIEEVDISKKAEHKKDPIHWFGILVPQALRKSQAGFKKAVEISCSLATLQCQYSELQDKYMQLMEQKRAILNEGLGSDSLQVDDVTS